MSRRNNPNAPIIAAWISLISNVILTILKIVIGTLFRSPVLLADGYHNAGDVVASAAALTSMRISQRPADDDHPYGHGKAEVISAAIVSIILGLAAVYIAYESVSAIFREPEKASIIAFLTAIISLVWKQVLYVYTIRIGKRTNSKGLIATAYDHLADVYASLAAVLGIGLALVGDFYKITIFAYADPIAGIIVTILVFKLAYHIGREALDTLMEKSVSPERLNDFTVLINSIREVKRIDRLRAREHGHYVLVDLRVAVRGELTVQEGHDIIREIKKAIKENHHDVDEVLIHLNPWYDQGD